MKTIRRNVFETNSSSTHNVTIMSKEDYNRWDKEGVYYDFNEDLFVTHNEMVEKYLREYNLSEIEDEDSFQDWLIDQYDIKTASDYFDDEYLEVDVTNHTTKSGDKIVIICKHGYNG